jgi:tetratricopeptide (TPR) repeat protein
MKRYLEAHPYADNWRLYFQVLLESTRLETRTPGDSAVLAAALVEGLREREDSLNKRPADSVIRCQAVSGYLAIAELCASSGATKDALRNLETAATLLTAGLNLAPDHIRLRCLKSRLETARAIELDQCGKLPEALSATDQAVAVAQKLVGDDPSYLYDLACALALKARLCPREAGPPIAAVAALRKAVQLGFDNVFKLKNDEHLAPIRNQEDFQKLADELAKKAAAPARGRALNPQKDHSAAQDPRAASGNPRGREAAPIPGWYGRSPAS